MNDITTFRVYGITVQLAPQTSAILRHLKTVGEISGVEAIAMYKARSLTKRISEINDALYLAVGDFTGIGNDPVQSEWKADSTGQRYKRYYISDEMRDNIVLVRQGVNAVPA